MGCSNSNCKQANRTISKKGLKQVHKRLSTNANHKLRWWAAPLSLFVALLPKCHFCLLTYSSAITLCSGKTLVTSSTNTFPWLTLIVIVLLLLSILLNYKGKKTWFSLGITAFGALCLLWMQSVNGAIWWYYVAAAILLFGTWVNGSFTFFWSSNFSLLSLSTSKLKLKKSPFNLVNTRIRHFFLHHKNRFT